MLSTDHPPSAPTRRQRGREAAIREIKEAALQELRQSGAGGVTMRGIARAIDMTPSGLYRYFDDHGALLAALCADAHDSLRLALKVAHDATPDEDCTSRWFEGSLALRNWALAHVDEYGLVIGPPLTGLDSAHPAVTRAAARLLRLPAETLIRAVANGELRPPPVSLEMRSAAPRTSHPSVPPLEAQSLAAVPAGARALAVGAVSALVGMVSLEAFGHLPGVRPDRERFYAEYSIHVMRGIGFTGMPRGRVPTA